MSQVDLTEREARVRAVLSLPPTAVPSQAAAALGMDQTTFRRIRLGRLWADVLPELERMTPEVTQRLCLHCVQWKPSTSRAGGDRQGSCLLGIPECRSDGHTWARGCGAYSPRS